MPPLETFWQREMMRLLKVIPAHISILSKPTPQIPREDGGVGYMMRWEGGGRPGGVKDSLRAVTRGPPSPLSQTSPTPPQPPGCCYSKWLFLKSPDLSQILSRLLKNLRRAAQAKQSPRQEEFHKKRRKFKGEI